MWIKARTIGEDFRRSQKRPNAAVRPKRQAVALQTETATMAGSENDPTGITLVFAWEYRLGNKAHLTFSADWSASNRAVSLNGLNRHSTAPCPSSWARTVSSLLAVMKTIGISFRRSFNSC